MALALDIPIQSIGSTTLRAAASQKAVQPDAAYYIANEPEVRGKDSYDPEKDPPPDLVVEMDVTNTSVPRLPVLARIGVPEVWRFDGRRVHFYRLGRSGRYREVQRSAAFPWVRHEDVTLVLRKRHALDEHSLIRAFVDAASRAHENAPRRDSKRTPKQP